MKRIIYAATVTFACGSAIGVTLVSSSLNSTARAADAVCELTSSPAATGGVVQQEIDAIAHCNSKKHSDSTMELFSTMKNPSPTAVNSQTVNSHAPIRDDRLSCPGIPQRASAEDFQYRAALERCKYGSGS